MDLGRTLEHKKVLLSTMPILLQQILSLLVKKSRLLNVSSIVRFYLGPCAPKTLTLTFILIQSKNETFGTTMHGCQMLR